MKNPLFVAVVIFIIALISLNGCAKQPPESVSLPPEDRLENNEALKNQVLKDASIYRGAIH